MSRWIWVSMILIVVIIAGVIFERVVHDNKKNAIINEQEILIKHYQNAKVKVDTVHDTIRMPRLTIIKPVPVVTHDTVRIAQDNPVHIYDTIFQKDRIKFRWMAKGNLDYIGFSDFTWPKEVITITRQVDTCIIDYKPPLIRWGAYAGMALNNFHSFPGLELGGQIVIKDQITLSAGCTYLNNIYGNVRIGFILR